MAATTNKTVFALMLSKLKAMGGVSAAVLGEIKAQSAQSGLVMVIPMSGRIDETVLNAPREEHSVSLVRIENAMQEPFAQVEERLDAWRAEILEDIWGDFDLGGTIAYPHATSTSWEYGHIQYNSTMYRYCDITVVYRIDPAAVFAA